MPDRDTTVKMEYKEPDESLYSSAEMSIVAGLKRENKRLMEQIYHTQGQMADVARLVCPFTGYDSCDATYPYIQDFYIPTNTIELISVRVYYKIRAFRAYSKATQSNAQQTSSSGGGTTTSSGGGTTATSSSGGSASITSGSGGGTTATSSNGLTSVTGTPYNTYNDGSRIYYIFQSGSGAYLLTASGSGDLSHSHSVKISPHTHSVSVSSHTHTVTIDDHTHTVSNHTHTVDGHTHDITFGIYEKTPSSPSIKVWLSQNGVDFPLFIGESTDDSDFEIATQIRGTGWKSIKFEVNELMQIVSNIIVVADIKVTN